MSLGTIGDDEQIRVTAAGLCVMRGREKLAGPFQSREDAVAWLLGRTVTAFGAGQRQLWAEVLERAGGIDADLYHLVGLAGLIRSGRSRAFILRSARPMPSGAIVRVSDVLPAPRSREQEVAMTESALVLLRPEDTCVG